MKVKTLIEFDDDIVPRDLFFLVKIEFAELTE